MLEAHLGDPNLDIADDVRATEPRFAPQWTLDGKHIVFSTRHWIGDDRTGETPSFPGIRLHVAASDGSRVLTLSDSDAQKAIDHSPSLSPDGSRIAYSSYRYDNEDSRYFEIWTSALDGTDRRRLTKKKGLDFAPTWSMDGARISFFRKSSDGCGRYNDDEVLQTTRADGSAIREALTRLANVFTFSNDDKRVRGTGDSSLRSDEPDDGEPTRGVYASRSLDGSRIAVAVPEASDVLLYTTAVDGSDVRVLARRGGIGVVEAVDSGRWLVADVASCSAGVVVHDPELNSGLVQDCEVLVEVFHSLAITGLNWNGDAPISQWEGVTLYDPTQEDSFARVAPRVRGLALPSRGLQGRFPSSVTDLTALHNLDLSDNRLFGTIPPEVDMLTELRALNLSNTQLSGAIPPEMGMLTELRALNLSNTQLSGAIPPEMGMLTNLRELSISGFITGPIPTELGMLASLEILVLNGRLDSPIPSELGNLASLKILNLINSNLTGLIPPELGNLTTLKQLSLRSNNLTGPIPPELGNLQSLETLDLAHNYDLTGCIPEGLRGKVIGYEEPEGCGE